MVKRNQKKKTFSNTGKDDMIGIKNSGVNDKKNDQQPMVGKAGSLVVKRRKR